MLRLDSTFDGISRDGPSILLSGSIGSSKKLVKVEIAAIPSRISSCLWPVNCQSSTYVQHRTSGFWFCINRASEMLIRTMATTLKGSPSGNPHDDVWAHDTAPLAQKRLSIAIIALCQGRQIRSGRPSFLAMTNTGILGMLLKHFDRSASAPQQLSSKWFPYTRQEMTLCTINPSLDD